MSLRSMLKTLFGRKYLPPEEEAYLRLREKGFAPAALIDVGAYQGEWTRLARRVFGPVKGLMVEAQEGKAPYLDRACSEMPGISWVNAVMGAEPGKNVTFYEMETGSSFFPERSNASRREKSLVTRTLDEVAADVPGPVFLKIDVQGAELEVLAGGMETLARAELVQLEVALLPYNEGAPVMLDVLKWMDAAGFVPFDISCYSRPNGVDLAQIDLLFVRRDSGLRRLYFDF